MRILSFLFLTIFMFSCGQDRSAYLYDEDSNNPDYLAIQEEERSRCANESRIFDQFATEQTLSGLQQEFSTNTLFMVKETEEGEDLDVYHFMKVLNITENDIRLQISSTESANNRIITFKASDRLAILKELSTGICANPKLYEYSSLDSSEALVIRQDRSNQSNSSDQNYETYSERVTFKVDLPMALSFWNRGWTKKKYIGGEATETKVEQVISEISNCNNLERVDAEEACNDLGEIEGLKTCSLTVNENAAKNRTEIGFTLFNFDNCQN